ncbi:MAG: metal ABC transporter ATP-binding protein [Deltaproteobacteria bacterium]|jgi:zinc transport system ATP-binding protein
MHNTPAIEVNNLWFYYEKQPILEAVTFVLQKGDFLGILGPNGGGKTTLLKLLLGMEKPAKGTIRILGQAPHDAHNRIAYVPQNTNFNLNFPVSVMDVALMGRLSRTRMGRGYSPEDKAIVEDVLKKAGMWGHRNSAVGTLSGGQRQRVFIARALATQPEILFLDEPTASVDPEFETDLYEFLKELNQRVTIVTITHDVGVISRYVKSVACINRRLIFHEEGKITREMLDMAYQCPVDLIAHGIPHRVLPEHGGE